ncbi:MAG: DUF1116 domain-containing protein [Acidimicrobiales bacterium]
MTNFLDDTPTFVNVGLSSFADSIRNSGADVDDTQWSPPGGEPAVARALASLVGDADVAHANQTAIDRFLAAQPALVAVAPAREVMSALAERRILHAGPPIEWNAMAGPMQGAIIGAILFEGWSTDHDDATRLAASGDVAFEPCHHHGAVGPMSGIISPTMPVWVVENSDRGNRSFSNMNEGLGRVLRFGANDDEVLDRLRWMRDRLGPALARIVEATGPIELKPIVSKALHMGDEVHNRNSAATSLFYRTLSLGALQVCDNAEATEVLSFIDSNDHFFLNLSMAMSKNMLDAAHGVPRSTLVTAMSRNGVHFGIRCSGTGDQWFETRSPIVDGLLFAGYTTEDAAPDLGDSSITETAGLGGFAMAASPAIVRFVGGTPSDANANSRRMGHITLTSNPAFTLPQLGFAGTPTGIDARDVVDTGILPVINTGIAHRSAGVGQIGAGITHAPRAVFDQAIRALASDPQTGEVAS